MRKGPEVGKVENNEECWIGVSRTGEVCMELERAAGTDNTGSCSEQLGFRVQWEDEEGFLTGELMTSNSHFMFLF